MIQQQTEQKKKSRLERLLDKYRAKGFTNVSDFLAGIGRRSPRSANAYSSGLDHFDRFLVKSTDYNIHTVLQPLLAEQINKYKLINDFVSYLQNDSINGHNLSPLSIKSYMIAVRSYLAYYDIETPTTKFKNKIKMPTPYYEPEEPIGASDIREMLNHCSNRRLKAFLLVLASAGTRAVETLALRIKDVNLDSSPPEIHIRAEYNKTKRGRDIFMSDEAGKYVRLWLDWKYRDRHSENKKQENMVRDKDDLIFALSTKNKDPVSIYSKILREFQKLLAAAGFTSRKEDGVYKRRIITLHSFRRFVKTTITNQTRNSDYSEWFLGHIGNPYYSNKPDDLKKIYKDDCMRYLVFLDYATTEAVGKSFEAQLKGVVAQKDNEIEALKQQIRQASERDSHNAERITQLENLMQGIVSQLHNINNKGTELINAVPGLEERLKEAEGR
jgi:integrase